MSTKPTALITGCSEGEAGHALALEFAAKGYRVFATARSTKSLAGLQEKGIELLTLDLDILFNNAGMMYEAPAIEADREQVQNMFNTNVFGLFDMVQAFTLLLLASVAGPNTPPTIINTASIVACVPYYFTA
ncbi:hypothetical protein FOVG_19723 [Fusarium oxysporum f. sp. pisi HDV247]|uniref:Uncharacterized protein n=1 Tax=Fusarium oxysporum f. sp. pisi HDV247 TaxID=1080344 RepID=W9NLC3_FUSOX|nr:hypothetical protein FOVG_19723 [Fusarium oxysporum f. sp. pisi HDV247]